MSPIDRLVYDAESHGVTDEAMKQKESEEYDEYKRKRNLDEAENALSPEANAYFAFP